MQWLFEMVTIIAWLMRGLVSKLSKSLLARRHLEPWPGTQNKKDGGASCCSCSAGPHDSPIFELKMSWRPTLPILFQVTKEIPRHHQRSVHCRCTWTAVSVELHTNGHFDTVQNHQQHHEAVEIGMTHNLGTSIVRLPQWRIRRAGWISNCGGSSAKRITTGWEWFVVNQNRDGHWPMMFKDDK